MDTSFPILAGTTPLPESVAGIAGFQMAGSRADHVHPRLTSATPGSLDSNGEATVNFTRLFATVPAVVCIFIESADNPPVVFKVKSWIQDGSNNYIGCVIKGYRSQTIPQNLVTLLLGGVFNLFAGVATNVSFTCIALQQSS